MKGHMIQSSRIWDYQIIQQLGKGQYGHVFKVKNKKNNNIYALKKVNISSCHQKQKIQAFRQIKALKLIHNPDIIQYYQSFLSMENIYIVMEYASKGDFSKIIKERRAKEKPFAEHQLWNIFGTLIAGVKYLHEKGIIHRDIKVQNIFMTQNGDVKLGDLGMSKVIHQTQKYISTRVGTPVYFAPEMIQNQLYSFGVDIWALGCVFYYLTTLEHPFKDATIQTLPYYVIEKDPKPIKGQYSGYLINFISSLLNKNPKERPNIHQVNNQYKNKDNPNPINKVLVYDIKKLLLMKPNIQKLQQLKKNYDIKDSVQHKRTSEKSPRNYREYLKLNVSSQRMAKRQKINQNDSLGIPNRIRNRDQMRSNSTSLYFTTQKKHLEDNPQNRSSFSPIKTNGFAELKTSRQLKNADFQGSNLSPIKPQKDEIKRVGLMRYAHRKINIAI